MIVAVTGASGFIGTALCSALRARGDRVMPLVRRHPVPGEEAIRWDPAARQLDAAVLAGVDAIVHLAGESLVGRWNAAKKRRIRDSRASGTASIARTLAAMAPADPRVLISASAIGYYGDRGDALLTEESPPGTGFLADVCREWESATAPAGEAGVRVALLRTGPVVGPGGGMLAQMLPVFRLGLGGPLGSGSQFWSWIALDDHVRATLRILDDAGIQGPVNLVAPNPVTNRDFTRILARVVGRPALLPVPRFAARLVLGELADSLFWSARVVPRKLLEAGFEFGYPELEGALRRASS